MGGTKRNTTPTERDLFTTIIKKRERKREREKKKLHTYDNTLQQYILSIRYDDDDDDDDERTWAQLKTKDRKKTERREWYS